MVKRINQLIGVFGIILVIVFFIQGATNSFDGDKMFLTLEMALGVVLLLLPNLLTAISKIKFPDMVIFLYNLFILLSVFLGTGFNLYSKVFYWDKILHFSSAMLSVALGIGLGMFIFNKLTFTKRYVFGVVLFGFLFAMTLGVFWEFYEFSFDGFLGLNMQRFETSDGTAFIGREALFDTMGDLFFNCIGAALFSIICYYTSLSKKPFIKTFEWINKRK